MKEPQENCEQSHLKICELHCMLNSQIYLKMSSFLLTGAIIPVISQYLSYVVMCKHSLHWLLQAWFLPDAVLWSSLLLHNTMFVSIISLFCFAACPVSNDKAGRGRSRTVTCIMQSSSLSSWTPGSIQTWLIMFAWFNFTVPSNHSSYISPVMFH